MLSLADFGYVFLHLVEKNLAPVQSGMCCLDHPSHLQELKKNRHMYLFICLFNGLEC